MLSGTWCLLGSRRSCLRLEAQTSRGRTWACGQIGLRRPLWVRCGLGRLHNWWQLRMHAVPLTLMGDDGQTAKTAYKCNSCAWGIRAITRVKVAVTRAEGLN